MAKTYTVKAHQSVVGRNGLGTRRRGGLQFGKAPVLVSTEEAAGAQVVTDEQLQAILADQKLVTAEAGAADIKKAKAATAPAAEADTSVAAPAPKRRPGRPAKVSIAKK